jgi:xylose isomerase
MSIEDLRNYAAKNGEPTVRSGKQELLENILNNHL